MTAGYTLPLFALRQALTAVKPFADPKDDDYAVVRLHPGTTMHVYATDGYSAALATVPITERDTDLADPVTLAVGDVEKVLAVFKMPGDKDQWGNAAVRVAPTLSDEVTITDASGLFEGQSLTLPAYTTRLPDLRRLVNSWLRAPVYRQAGDWGASQRFLTQVTTAAKTYGEPAYLNLRDGHRAPTWMATIGEAFIAGCVTVEAPLTEGTETTVPEHTRRAWRNTLAGSGPVAAEEDR